MGQPWGPPPSARVQIQCNQGIELGSATGPTKCSMEDSIIITPCSAFSDLLFLQTWAKLPRAPQKRQVSNGGLSTDPTSSLPREKTGRWEGLFLLIIFHSPHPFFSPNSEWAMQVPAGGTLAGSWPDSAPQGLFHLAWWQPPSRICTSRLVLSLLTAITLIHVASILHWTSAVASHLALLPPLFTSQNSQSDLFKMSMGLCHFTAQDLLLASHSTQNRSTACHDARPPPSLLSLSSDLPSSNLTGQFQSLWYASLSLTSGPGLGRPPRLVCSCSSPSSLSQPLLPVQASALTLPLQRGWLWPPLGSSRFFLSEHVTQCKLYSYINVCFVTLSSHPPPPLIRMSFLKEATVDFIYLMSTVRPEIEWRSSKIDWLIDWSIKWLQEGRNVPGEKGSKEIGRWQIEDAKLTLRWALLMGGKFTPIPPHTPNHLPQASATLGLRFVLWLKHCLSSSP